MHALLATISTHPHAALAIIFVTAFLESAAFVGTVAPAGIVMFTGGVLYRENFKRPLGRITFFTEPCSLSLPMAGKWMR